MSQASQPEQKISIARIKRLLTEEAAIRRAKAEEMRPLVTEALILLLQARKHDACERNDGGREYRRIGELIAALEKWL